MKKDIDLQHSSPLSALVQAQGKGNQFKSKAGDPMLKFSDIINKLPLQQPAIPAQSVGALLVRVRNDMSPKAGDESAAQTMLHDEALPGIADEEGLQLVLDKGVEQQPFAQGNGEDENEQHADVELQQLPPPEAVPVLRTGMVVQEVQLALSQVMPKMQEKPLTESGKLDRSERANEADTKNRKQVRHNDAALKPTLPDLRSEKEAPKGDALQETRSNPQEAIATDRSVESKQPDEVSAKQEAKIEPSFSTMPQNASTPAEQKIAFTVLKVETVLLSAAAPANPPVMSESLPKSLDANSLASTAWPVTASPNTNIVRTIHIQLRPENLGELKVSMHLKGEELRLSVEVYTLEAHAALQRDKGMLREVLEKAGYDLAEQSISVTLRLEPPGGQQPSPSNDNLSFSRGQSSEQGSRGASNGEQQRQTSRQPGKDQHDAHSRHNQPETSRGQPASGIYI